MTIRNDFRVNYALSPRIVRVLAPSTEVTVQDLHDTLVDIEDEPYSLGEDPLISSAGKEELGGGITVGLTSTLLNTRLAFDARKTSISEGTVTTTDTAGVILTDSAATFETDGVQPGAWIVNLSDGSICSVLTVDSQIQITTDGLGDGTNNKFTMADAYKIWPVIQVELTGGNVVAVDELLAELDPILPTAGTQAVRTSSSSATLQELQDIQFASFSGGVWINVIGGTAGTAFPTGTERQPVNNLTDLLTIATTRGFNTVYVVGDLSLGVGDVFDGFIFVGQNPNLTSIDVDTAASVTNCEFRECYLTGVLDGGSIVRRAIIQDLNYVDGSVYESMLETGTITLGGGTTAHFLDCYSGVPGLSTPIIDLGGSGQALAIRGYSGGLRLANKSGTEAVSIDLNSGHVYVEDTVQGTGDIVIRGVGHVHLVDTLDAEIDPVAWVGAPITDQTFDGVRQALIDKILRNKAVTDPATGVMTVYDDDDTTVLVTANIYEDVAGTTPYALGSQRIDRRDRLTE